MTARTELLLKAVAAVARRGASYGPPGEHFQRTCDAIHSLLPDLWLRKPTPADWAKMMIADKLSRDAEQPKEDNALDVAGYAACLAEVRGTTGTGAGVTATIDGDGVLGDIEWLNDPKSKP